MTRREEEQETGQPRAVNRATPVITSPSEEEATKGVEYKRLVVNNKSCLLIIYFLPESSMCYFFCHTQF